jgi:branched-chain amino acid transport system permease protein
MIATTPWLELTVAGLSQGAVFGLLALGLVLIYRTTGVLNFGHWAIGLMAITIYALISGTGIPALVAVPISVTASILTGIIAYRFVFRWIPRSNQIIMILIAFGVAQLFSSVAQFALGFKNFTTLPGWIPGHTYHVGTAAIYLKDIVTFLVAVGLGLGFLVWFRASRTGRALRAVAQNREAALLAGIDDVKYSSIAWAIGAALAALSLLLLLPHRAVGKGLITTIDLTPFGTTTILVAAFGAALVGGLVNMPAALAGGFVFGLAQSYVVLSPALSNLQETISAGLIVILLLARMERLFTTQQEREALET